MGSVGSPNNWAPYDANYRECSHGVCSIYCPQWCSMVFPPPPPFFPEEEDDDSSKTNFSPLIIAIIGILASIVLLVIYYTLISKYCRRRRDHQNRINQIQSGQNQMDGHDDLQWQVPSTGGLEGGLIKSIAVCKYKKGDGLVEGTECVVCLSEFQEDESLRLLPKCNHAFHLPCIDTWLKSHSNCPLCRAVVVVVSGGNSQISPSSTTVNVSSLEVQRREDDRVFVVDGGREREGEVVVSFGGDDEIDDSGSPSVGRFRRSISVDSFACQADHGQDPRMEIRRLPPGIGSSGGTWGDDRRSTKDGNGLLELIRSPVAGVKRSISTETFKIRKNDKGKNFTIPV